MQGHCQTEILKANEGSRQPVTLHNITQERGLPSATLSSTKGLALRAHHLFQIDEHLHQRRGSMQRHCQTEILKVHDDSRQPVTRHNITQKRGLPRTTLSSTKGLALK